MIFALVWVYVLFASQGFRSRSPLSSPLADWAGISDPHALDFYWMQLLLAASNKITANNRSKKHHVYEHWAQPFYIYVNTKLLKAPIGQKWCHLCRLGLWKPLEGDSWKLQNPASEDESMYVYMHSHWFKIEKVQLVWYTPC